MLDALHNYASQQSLTGTSDQLSSNIYNAGKAIKLCDGHQARNRAKVTVTAVGGTNPTFRGRYVGADDAALSSNVEILCDTGTTGVLASSNLPLDFEMAPSQQKAAKQYYGWIFTQGGTSPTATVNANFGPGGQSRMLK